jgi:hypothetical protein
MLAVARAALIAELDRLTIKLTCPEPVAITGALPDIPMEITASPFEITTDAALPETDMASLTIPAPVAEAIETPEIPRDWVTPPPPVATDDPEAPIEMGWLTLPVEVARACPDPDMSAENPMVPELSATA